MANVLVDENSLSAIANAIRTKNGSLATYKPAEMAPAIVALGGDENDAVLTALTVTQNGVYTPPEGVDGFKSVTVNVQSSAPLSPELEYIETTGVEYINTGIYPTTNTKVEAKFRVDEFQAQALFGSRRTASSSDRFATFMTTSTLAHCQFYNKSYDIEVPDYTGKEIVAVLSKEGYFYDGELLQTVPQTSFTSDYSMYLLALNSKDTVDRPIKGRLYYCKIWQDDVLMRDYVPVHLGNKIVCLYDKVNDKFYFNEGTGGFIAGPVKG